MVDGMPLHSTADLIISADTIVVLNGKILEKPKDKDEATAMISSLSGNTRDGKCSVFALYYSYCLGLFVFVCHGPCDVGVMPCWLHY